MLKPTQWFKGLPFSSRWGDDHQKVSILIVSQTSVTCGTADGRTELFRPWRRHTSHSNCLATCKTSSEAPASLSIRTSTALWGWPRFRWTVRIRPKVSWEVRWISSPSGTSSSSSLDSSPTSRFHSGCSTCSGGPSEYTWLLSCNCLTNKEASQKWSFTCIKALAKRSQSNLGYTAVLEVILPSIGWWSPCLCWHDSWRALLILGLVDSHPNDFCIGFWVTGCRSPWRQPSTLKRPPHTRVSFLSAGSFQDEAHDQVRRTIK